MKQLSQLMAQASRMAATLTKDEELRVVDFLKECLEEDRPHPLANVFDAINSRIGFFTDVPNPVEFEQGDYVNGGRVERVTYREMSVAPFTQIVHLNMYGERQEQPLTAQEAIDAANVPPYDQRLTALATEATRFSLLIPAAVMEEMERDRLEYIATGAPARFVKSIVELTAPKSVVKEWPMERVEQSVIDVEDFLAMMKRQYMEGTK